jgi:hypothetical protein
MGLTLLFQMEAGCARPTYRVGLLKTSQRGVAWKSSYLEDGTSRKPAKSCDNARSGRTFFLPESCAGSSLNRSCPVLIDESLLLIAEVDLGMRRLWVRPFDNLRRDAPIVATDPVELIFSQ